MARQLEIICSITIPDEMNNEIAQQVGRTVANQVVMAADKQYARFQNKTPEVNLPYCVIATLGDETIVNVH